MSYDKLPPVARFSLMRSEFKYTWHPETKRYTKRADANPKSPDYFGTISLDLVPGAPPVKLRVSGWVSPCKGDNAEGRMCLSGSIDYHKDEQRRLDIKAEGQMPVVPPPSEVPQPAAEQDDSDLPF